MIWRRFRVLALAAALWMAGGALAFGHEAASGPALSVPSIAVHPALSGSGLGSRGTVLWLGVLTLAVLLLSVLSPAAVSLKAATARRRARCGFRSPNRARGNSRCGPAASIAVALLALWLWVLPWLSLHDTHHALQGGETACSVAQIVHSQSGGILPLLPALAPPPAAEPIPLPAPLVLHSRIAPEPAARSPPV
jgi:hypothetical protein